MISSGPLATKRLQSGQPEALPARSTQQGLGGVWEFLGSGSRIWRFGFGVEGIESKSSKQVLQLAVR